MSKCPTCSNEFKSEQGMKTHHKRIHGESISGVVVACSNCGDEIRRRKSHIEKYDNVFCGNSCKNEHHSKLMTGRERSEEYKSHMSEVMSGENCYWYGVTGEDHPGWRGGEKDCQNWRSSHEWLQVREEALKRDNNECQDCKQSKDLHVHHIKPVSKGGKKFKLDNLITLCVEHHYDRHRSS